MYREMRLSWDLRVDVIRQENQQAAAKGTREPSEHVLSCTQFGLKSRIRFQAKARGLTVYYGNLTALTRWVSAGGILQGNTFPLEIAGNNEKAQMKMPSIHTAKAICSGFASKFNTNISLSFKTQIPGFTLD